jgi:o-succinylbenzoate synthase
MKLSVVPFELKLKKPLHTARGVLSKRSGFRVCLESAGVVGRGDACALEAFGTESLEATHRALLAFELSAVPTSVSEVSELTRGLHAAPAARFAIESALLEYVARATRQPVAALLSGPPKAFIDVHALIDGTDARELSSAAEAAALAGFRTVKVKVAARPLSVDAQRLLAVRRALGPNIAIRIDANGGWSEGQARVSLRGLSSLNLAVCEQPVRADDVGALRRLRNQVPCAIAADESVGRPDLIPKLLEEAPIPAVEHLVLKPAVLGGILPALELAQRAWKVGVSSFVTTLLDGPIARAAAVHLAACLPGPNLAHGLSTIELFENLACDELSPTAGVIRLSSGAGWGVH